MAVLYNQSHGSLAGYDCPDCLNKGNVQIVNDEGRMSIQPCRCMRVREAKRRIEGSGLAGMIDTMTFSRYADTEPWQRQIKETAIRYVKAVKAGSTDWLVMTGQPGSGKTHLCTAVCGELMNYGLPVRYMQWTSDSNRIKGNRFDEEAMGELLYPLKTVEVLYIDDLFKTITDAAARKTPSEADVRLAFEILNDRVTRNKITIISCEMSLTGDLLEIDEATFSRAYEKAKRFICQIGRGAERNYRLRGT